MNFVTMLTKSNRYASVSDVSKPFPPDQGDKVEDEIAPLSLKHAELHMPQHFGANAGSGRRQRKRVLERVSSLPGSIKSGRGH